MRRVQIAVALTALVARQSDPAHAALLEASRAGVMCASPEALARLSLPDGSSRTEGDHPPAALEAIAREGNCVDFPKGNVVILLKARHNTSIVRSDTLSGDGVLDTFLVANIDYQPYTPPPDPVDDAIRHVCPARLETLIVLGVPATDFVQSLPPSLRGPIEREVDQQCPDGSPVRCFPPNQDRAIRERHLETRWADFVCRHP